MHPSFQPSNVVVLVPPTSVEYIQLLTHDLAVMDLAKWILATVVVLGYLPFGLGTFVLMPVVLFLFCKAFRLKKKITAFLDENTRGEEIRFKKFVKDKE